MQSLVEKYTPDEMANQLQNQVEDWMKESQGDDETTRTIRIASHVAFEFHQMIQKKLEKKGNTASKFEYMNMSLDSMFWFTVYRLLLNKANANAKESV